MGTCKYCGQDAGFFSHAHKECEEKHEQGVVKLEDGINRYFTDAIRINDLTRLVAKLKRGNYVIDADIAATTAKCIEEYTENTHWPYNSHQLDLVSEYVSRIGVPYDSLNSSGAFDRLCQKMIRGFLAEYFTGQKPLQRVLQISSALKFQQRYEGRTYAQGRGLMVRLEISTCSGRISSRSLALKFLLPSSCAFMKFGGGCRGCGRGNNIFILYCCYSCSNNSLPLLVK